MQLTCDRCDKAFVVENPQPGAKVECPNCGDVNVIPGGAARPVAVAAQPARDRAAEEGYPPANGPEVDVMMVRPAMLGGKPIRFLLLVLAVIAGLGGAGYFQFYVKPSNQPVAIGCAAVAVLALIWLGVWKVHNLGEGLKITTKRTIEIKGLLSKATSEVLHADIRNIQVRQSFLDRIWNVGTLELSSSAEHENEIEMTDVPSPMKVRGVIDLYRPM